MLGHAGMGLTRVYPMNSFESVLKCLSIGADGSEIDVQMTKDSVLVAFHSATLESATTLSGEIHNKTWNEIKEAEYNTLPYTQYKIIRLDDLFSNIPNLKSYVFSLDCKSYIENLTPEYINTFTNAIIKVIDQFAIEDRVFVEFQNRAFIQAIKTKRPSLKVLVYQAFNNALDIANEFDLTGISISVENITKSEVEYAHSKVFLISVFNTNTNKKTTKPLR